MLAKKTELSLGFVMEKKKPTLSVENAGRSGSEISRDTLF